MARRIVAALCVALLEQSQAWQPPAWWAAATAPLTKPLGIERNDGVRLRLGKESDADAIRALWAATVSYTHLTLPTKA